MGDFNTIVTVIREAMPLMQSSISGLAGAFITAMFLRGNTSRQEFNKIKAGKINDALDALVKSGELTLTELVKCKNLVSIARLADEYYTKGKKEKTNNSQDKQYEFDWFLRFFETAGNISNDEMQNLWASILVKEVDNPGEFSYRALQTLYTMNKGETESLTEIKPYILNHWGESFLYNGSGGFELLVGRYNGDDIVQLNDCGIIDNMVPMDYKIRAIVGSKLANNHIGLISDNDIMLRLGRICCIPHNEAIMTVSIPTIRLTSVGRELAQLAKINDIYAQEYEQYAIKCFSMISKSNPRLKLSIHTCLQKDREIVIGPNIKIVDNINYDKW